MCGIAGIIQTEPSFYSNEQLQKMTAALSHRGPDGEGHWINASGHCLLGHRRLSVIDLTRAGSQPMPYLDRYTIIHNGEIYNYPELRETLSKKGYVFRSQTDTEVIAAAYDCWQDDCITHFDGMFAFAIWDEKERKLFAARDRFGEKPFFYHYSKRGLLFASEMKALWTAGVPRVANQKMLFNFITIGYTDNPAQPGETFFEDIFRLPPASTLSYAPGDAQPVLELYWEIDPAIEDKKITEENALSTFHALLTQSVTRRLRSDVPVGTSLSGGLDSSAIVSLVHDLSPLPQAKAFTAIFPGFEKDESVFASMIATEFNLQQYTVSMSPRAILDDWSAITYHQEEPFGSASVVAQYKVFELAKKENIKVLLDGQGADETLAGYRKYYKWYWQELFRKRHLFRSRELKAAREAGIAERFDYKNMIAAYFPGFATVMLENQYLLRAIRHPELTPEFVKLQSKEAYYTTPDHFTLNGVLHFNTCVHGLEELLRYADRNAMAHGREVRLPFLSHELVEFVFSLPARFKIRDAWSKWILRKSMDKRLPAAINWRRNKVGFEPPQKKWMEDPHVQEAIRSAKAKLVHEKILKPAVLERPVNPVSAHDADNFDWRYFSAAALF